jgi:hypothetical protein
MTRSAAYDTLARVRDEMGAARFALGVTLRGWHLHLVAAASSAGGALSHGDVQRCLNNLEVTYILRLFGAWEAILRDFWLDGVGRDTEPDLVQLIDSLAGRRSIDPQTLITAHDLRRFRNEIVHENVQVLRYDFSQCAKGLGTFIAYLPKIW